MRRRNAYSAKRGFRLIPTTALPNLAIPVRSDWKGHGLGHLLMARLIQLARERGIDGLVGKVLPVNSAMLQLCREFGPRDPIPRLASMTLHDII
jgi:GNAT superfamily N-acetyltransferase